MSNYHRRNYQVFLVVGNTLNLPLYHASKWREIRPLLSQLFSLTSRKPTGVRSSQIDLTQRKHKRFGKISWSAEGDAKWNHDSPLTKGLSLHFEGTQIWVPIWTVCSNEGAAPDVFVNLSHSQSDQNYDEMFVLAIHDGMPEPARLLGFDVARKAGSLLKDPVAAESCRPWGVDFGRFGGFGDCIQELSHSVHHALCVAAKPVTVSLFPGNWQAIVL